MEIYYLILENVDDITSSVYPFAVYTTYNAATYGHTWKLEPVSQHGTNLRYTVDSAEITSYDLSNKFRSASWDSEVGGSYTIADGFVTAYFDFIITDEDNTYYIQDAITKRYLEVFEKPGWGTTELDGVFWQLNPPTTLTDYHKFKIVAV